MASDELLPDSLSYDVLLPDVIVPSDKLSTDSLSYDVLLTDMVVASDELPPDSLSYNVLLPDVVVPSDELPTDSLSYDVLLPDVVVACDVSWPALLILPVDFLLAVPLIPEMLLLDLFLAILPDLQMVCQTGMEQEWDNLLKSVTHKPHNLISLVLNMADLIEIHLEFEASMVLQETSSPS